MTAVGRHFGSQVVGLLDLERAEPPRVPAAAVELERHARPRRASTAASTSPATPGCRPPGSRTPKVLFGETAPTGFDTVNPRREGSRALLHDVAPLAFLREALCLNARYRRAGSLREAADERLRPPRLHAGRQPVLRRPGTRRRHDRLALAADRARSTARPRADAIPRHLPIYLTEFGVQSFPNRELGVPVAKQAEYDAIAEHIAWSNPRVAAFSQYLLKDDPLGGKPGSSVAGGSRRLPDRARVRQRQAEAAVRGLAGAADRQPQPRRGYSLWGLVRPATGATKVTVLVAAQGLALLPGAEDGHHQQPRLLGAELERGARPGACAGRARRADTYEGPPIRAY